MPPSHASIGTSVRSVWDGPLVDIDLHAAAPSIETLSPYLADVWRQHAGERGWGGPRGEATYPRAIEARRRARWQSTTDGEPGAQARYEQDAILHRMEVDYAIVNCVAAIDGGPPDFSVGVARALNDWLIAEWLEVDPRFRASIILPTRSDPVAMAAEIERVGDHPGFVQALLPVRSGRPYGQRVYWPVFDAIVRHDLVAGVNLGGSNDGLPPTPAGWPSWYIEEYAAEVGNFQAQVLSVIAEGTFARFPDLRMTLIGSGFTWVPMLLWDMDRNWMGLRREVPWLTRPPFEVLRDHIRLSTAPLEATSAAELEPVIDWLGSDRMLMFAFDDLDDTHESAAVLLDALPEEGRQRVMADNAREWYRLESGAKA